MKLPTGALALVAGGVLAAVAVAPVLGLVGGVEAPSEAVSVQQTLDFEFYRENIEPIFIRPRGSFMPGDVACAACHTWQTTTPLDLQPLELDESVGVYWTEEQSRQNFQVVSRLVVPGDPDNSRLLRKPLASDAGGASAHTGGVFWESKDDPEWQVMAEWVRAASPTGPPEAVPELDFEFFRNCVQPVFVNPIENASACTECHAGGNRGFARPPAAGEWTEAESRASYEALMQLIEPGYPEYSRFLHHPLDRDGGGDFMHNGGRRWQTRDDPEWQALAGWIRGDLEGGSCPAALQF